MLDLNQQPVMARDDSEKKFLSGDVNNSINTLKKFEKFEANVDSDLIVILNLISSNAGANVCSDVTKSLFDRNAFHKVSTATSQTLQKL
ncbi:hypothetical protein OESDEN_08576 [Oesophagostomum dentatum]|uniref:Uncharacterized protein n=1 Tax=Oesophagostomum dentatum TaxID=61180 RepID=A0A0B1T1Y5_OESDE|nr:hypothetical protein OESDEN_08576 [Oesophagostomum dentatum]